MCCRAGWKRAIKVILTVLFRGSVSEWEGVMTPQDYTIIVEALQDALKNSNSEEHAGIVTATVHIARKLKADNPKFFRMAKFIDVVCNYGFSGAQVDSQTN
jgi:hypothetical protein